jgi:hypothetical protein
VAGKIEKGEAPMLIRERLEIRPEENLDGLFAGINLQLYGRVAKVDPRGVVLSLIELWRVALSS